MAIVLHEQATNAVRYGALSNEAGQVIVEGQMIGDAFRITWLELGDPTISLLLSYPDRLAAAGVDPRLV